MTFTEWNGIILFVSLHGRQLLDPPLQAHNDVPRPSKHTWRPTLGSLSWKSLWTFGSESPVWGLLRSPQWELLAIMLQQHSLSSKPALSPCVLRSLFAFSSWRLLSVLQVSRLWHHVPSGPAPVGCVCQLSLSCSYPLPAARFPWWWTSNAWSQHSSWLPNIIVSVVLR